MSVCGAASLQVEDFFREWSFSSGFVELQLHLYGHRHSTVVEMASKAQLVYFKHAYHTTAISCMIL